jgi:hypothetical protein
MTDYTETIRAVPNPLHYRTVEQLPPNRGSALVIQSVDADGPNVLPAFIRRAIAIPTE